MNEAIVGLLAFKVIKEFRNCSYVYETYVDCEIERQARLAGVTDPVVLDAVKEKVRQGFCDLGFEWRQEEIPGKAPSATPKLPKGIRYDKSRWPQDAPKQSSLYNSRHATTTLSDL